MNIIITLAGKSNRFREEGINTPKFLLPISKKTILEKILETYDDQDNYHLVFSKSQIKKNSGINNYLKKIKKNIYVNVVEDHDLGPAYSVLKADSCRTKKDIIVSYCDFLINWNYKKFKREVFGYDYAITSFRGFHPSSFTGTLYCYLKVKNKEIKNLREKKSFTNKPHNEYASTGSYYFKSYDIMENYLNKALKSKEFKKKFKEIYMSLPYIFIIKENKPILNFEVDKFVSLGPPKDYKEFISWHSFFNNKL